MTKYLVTGADGFIGSHLVQRLLAEGHEVRALAYYTSFGTAGWLDDVPESERDGLEIILGDVRDANQMRQLVAGCDVVLHLAALIGIPYSYVAPDSYVATNVSGTLNVLQAARDAQVSRTVVTSTSETYGSAQRIPIDEDHPLVAQSPYAATKIAADQLALSFHRSFDMPVAVARPFNTYGPRQSTRAVIPTVITQIARGQPRVHLGSLSPTRDFTYVADTADAFVALAACDDALGQVVNFGSGFEISIGDTVQLIAEVMSADVEITTDETRVRPPSSEVERLFADARRARDLVGWEPRFGGRDGFRDGLAMTAEWFADPGNLARYAATGYTV